MNIFYKIVMYSMNLALFAAIFFEMFGNYGMAGAYCVLIPGILIFILFILGIGFFKKVTRISNRLFYTIAERLFAVSSIGLLLFLLSAFSHGGEFGDIFTFSHPLSIVISFWSISTVSLFVAWRVLAKNKEEKKMISWSSLVFSSSLALLICFFASIFFD